MARTVLRVALALVAAVPCVILDARQSVTTPATVVAGAVVDGATKRPVSGATVSLTGPLSMTAQTGPDGRFQVKFSGDANRLQIAARKPGYLVGYRGQLGPNDNVGSPLDIADGERLEGLVIRIWPEGVIHGVVTDERRQPVVGATVVALTQIYTGGGRQWWRSSVPTRTDDRGEYRIERLSPLDYIVAVRPPPATGESSLATAFSPGVRTAAAASIISVAGDSHVADVTLEPGRVLRRVSGELVGATSNRLGMVVRLLTTDADGTTSGFEEMTTTADVDGRFHFDRVAEGTFRLRVCEFPRSEVTLYTVSGDFHRNLVGFLGPRPDGYPTLPPLPSEPTWTADMAVTVDARSSSTVVVPLQHGAKIRGRVLFQGSTAKPAANTLSTVPVVVRTADGGQSFEANSAPVPQGRIEVDGSFSSVGLPAGDYVIGFLSGFDAIKSWKLGRIQSGGRDVLGIPIQLNRVDVTDVVLTLTDKPTEIVGTVASPQGPTKADARVIIFPRDQAERRNYWASPAPRRIIQAMPSRQGTFRAEVPAGDYLVAAVTSDLPPLWMAPEYLELLSVGAAPVRLALGERQTVTVTPRAYPADRR